MASLYYEELEGSPRLNFGLEKATATRMFWLPDWSQINQFVSQFARVEEQGSKLKTFHIEHYPGFPRLLVSDIKIEPMVKDAIVYRSSPNFYFRGASITVDYSSELKATSVGAVKNLYATHKTKIGSEYITYPGSVLVWQSDGVQAGTDIHAGVNSVHIEHDIVLNFVINPPWESIRFCAGKVNARKVLGAPPECLLFLGADTEIQFLLGQELAYKVNYKFAEKNNGTAVAPKGWNHFLRPGIAVPAFERLQQRGGKAIYQSALFEELFGETVAADPAFIGNVLLGVIA